MNSAPISNDPLARLEQLRHKSAVKGLVIHASIFALTISGLAVINILTKGDWWVQWPLMGWGLGLAGHALLVYLKSPRPVPSTTESRPGP